MTPACIHQNNTPISASHQNHGAFVMKKSYGKNCDPSPDYMEKAWLDFLDRNFRSNEEAAVHFDVTEGTIRNWKAMGLTRAALRVLYALGRNPDLRCSLFGPDQ